MIFPPELASEIQKGIHLGRYKTTQDFILTAVQNQVYIENSDISDGGSLENSGPSSVRPKTASVTVSTLAGSDAKHLLRMPEGSSVKTVPLGELTRPTYLWGQYNRLFPVKIIMRVAANLSGPDGSGYVPLEELQEESADIAREMGRLILRKDRALGRKRGDIISAALPIGRNEDKTKTRFKNQFVGFLTRNRVEGAASVLKFLDITRTDKNRILAGITDLGLKFASLPNPIIDEDDYSTAFSPEEVEFLLNHIASEVPEEAKLVSLVLGGIRKGVATPEQLNDLVRSHNPDWNENQAIAIRSGIVSRMSELGLLGRNKDGVKVTYILNELGENYLERLGMAT